MTANLYAMVDGAGHVVSTIVITGGNPDVVPVPDGDTLISCGDLEVTTDWTYAGGKFVAPPPPQPLPPNVIEYNTRLAAGYTVVSAGNSATSGTFPIDGTFADGSSVVSASTGIYTGIKVGDGLPGGASTFLWSDVNGSPHPFTGEQFIAFFLLQRDYRYNLAMQAQFPTPVWPSATGNIP